MNVDNMLHKMRTASAKDLLKDIFNDCCYNMIPKHEVNYYREYKAVLKTKPMLVYELDVDLTKPDQIYVDYKCKLNCEDVSGTITYNHTNLSMLHTLVNHSSLVCQVSWRYKTFKDGLYGTVGKMFYDNGKPVPNWATEYRLVSPPENTEHTAYIVDCHGCIIELYGMAADHDHLYWEYANGHRDDAKHDILRPANWMVKWFMGVPTYKCLGMVPLTNYTAATEKARLIKNKIQSRKKVNKEMCDAIKLHSISQYDVYVRDSNMNIYVVTNVPATTECDAMDFAISRLYGVYLGLLNDCKILGNGMHKTTYYVLRRFSFTLPQCVVAFPHFEGIEQDYIAEFKQPIDIQKINVIPYSPLVAK